MKTLLTTLCALFAINAHAKIQGADVKSLTEVGNVASRLIPTDKIYDLQNSQQLSSSITSGLLGGGGGGGLNLLTTTDNPGFEQGTTGWTASGGTFSTTTSSPFFGSKMGTWTATASSQTLSSASKAVVVGLQGKNCLAAFTYSYSGTSGDYSAQVYDGTNVVASQSLATSSTPQAVALNFICPSSGSVLVRFISNVASPGQINLDGYDAAGGLVQLGSALNVSNVSQAALVGGVVISGCGGAVPFWRTTSGTLSDFSALTGCTYTPFGSAVADTAFGSTQLLGVKFSSLPPGEYKLEVETGIQFSSSGASSSAAAQFWDGTNTARELSTFAAPNGSFVGSPNILESISYTTAQSNVHLRVRGQIKTGSGTFDIGRDGSGAQNTVIRVYRYPSAAQQAVTVDTQAASWSGYHNKDCLWTQTNGTPYADPAGVASPCALVTIQSQGLTVTSALSGGNPIPGIVFTPPRTGLYEVCGDPSVYNNSPGNAGFLRLYDGSTAIGYATNYYHGSTGGKSIPLCGYYNATNLSQVTIKIQAYTSAGSQLAFNGGGLEPLINWRVKAISQGFPAPILVGSVTSNTSGTERVERAYITNNGSTCAVSTQTGSWLSSCTRTNTGELTITVASGIFTDVPVCFGSTRSASADTGAQGMCTNCGAPTTPTSTSFKWQTRAAGGGVADYNFNLFCMGPK